MFALKRYKISLWRNALIKPFKARCVTASCRCWIALMVPWKLILRVRSCVSRFEGGRSRFWTAGRARKWCDLTGFHFWAIEFRIPPPRASQGMSVRKFSWVGLCPRHFVAGQKNVIDRHCWKLMIHTVALLAVPLERPEKRAIFEQVRQFRRLTLFRLIGASVRITKRIHFRQLIEPSIT